MPRITCPAGVWTAIQPAGFGSKGVQPSGPYPMVFALSAAAPSAGDVSGVHVGSGQYETLGTDDAALGLWARSLMHDEPGYVNVMS